jgi:RNA polymerase sigma factor (sigma-70 family)
VMADLAELYHRYSRAAMAAAWMAVGDADRASEIVQDTFVRCAARRSAIRDERAFGAYWQQAVVRAAANEHRRMASAARLRDRLGSRDAVARRVDIADDVTLRITANDALRALPAHQRAVLVARFYLDLSVGETAELLGMSEGTVKSTTSRSLVVLREALGEAASR